MRRRETNVEARQQQVAQAQLNTAELKLSYTQAQVLAPYDGFVTKRNV